MEKWTREPDLKNDVQMRQGSNQRTFSGLGRFFIDDLKSPPGRAENLLC